MEIKAELLEPYSEEERLNFIVENNHNKGYEIRETENALQAWGYTQQEEEEREQERINNLTMTPLDFIKVLSSFGLSLLEINTFLDSHLEIKTQLTYCNLVYCGVAKSFLPITIGELTITPEMIEQAFILHKNEEI